MKTYTINGSGGRPMLTDLHLVKHKHKSPLIIYAHGFCGFKDWGNFNLVADQFVDAGFNFAKFNFSHNGTTVENPELFTDLEAFGHNNYSKEIFDLQQVIHHFASEDIELVDSNKIGLIGHSMGGGISILTAAINKNIKALNTWASIAECKTPWTNWDNERIEQWKTTGVEYYHNGRTKQDLPLYYQLFEDFKNNKDQLDILSAAAAIDIPFLISHGTEDSSVPFSAAEEIKAASKNAEIFSVASDHVFGRMHPYEQHVLPQPMQEVVTNSINFFEKNL